jgi:hypothetical protein
MLGELAISQLLMTVALRSHEINNTSCACAKQSLWRERFFVSVVYKIGRVACQFC